jgi:hypothetical protein
LGYDVKHIFLDGQKIYEQSNKYETHRLGVQYEIPI